METGTRDIRHILKKMEPYDKMAYDIDSNLKSYIEEVWKEYVMQNTEDGGAKDFRDFVLNSIMKSQLKTLEKYEQD